MTQGQVPVGLLLSGEAEAGMEARAIPEERIKAMMRRMANLVELTGRTLRMFLSP
jgi:hypothetical protein